MGYVKCIGHLGAWAVALGVVAAASATGVASAETADGRTAAGSGTDSATDSDSSTDTDSGIGTAAHPSPDDSSTSDSATPIGSTPSPPTRVGNGRADLADSSADDDPGILRASNPRTRAAAQRATDAADSVSGSVANLVDTILDAFTPAGALPPAQAHSDALSAADLNPIGNAAPAQVQLTPPDVADPGTWLPFVTDVVHDVNVLAQRNVDIYDLNDQTGRTALALDYTWGLPGTMLGYGIQVINMFWATDPMYRDDLSVGQNRHVYEGGFYLKEGFAHTQGNTATNMGFNGSGVNMGVLDNHESLHMWQSRLFGPAYQGTYVGWAAAGLPIATAVWLTDTDQDLFSLIETAVYYDNPFEYWAYQNNNQWPPSGANPILAWP